MLLPEGLRCADRERFTYGYGYFLPWKNAMVPSLTAQGAEVVCFGAKSGVQLCLRARRLAKFLKQWKADVLHCHLPVAGVVGRIAGRMAGVPVVYTEHNKMERYHLLTRRLNVMTWNWQERVIAVSEDVAASIHGHVRSDVPVDVVLNGVNIDHFNPDHCDGNAVRQQLGIPAGAPVVSTVAVFRVQKKLDDWLRAAKLVRNTHPKARFLLVGDGPLCEELKEQAAALGLERAVHFVGLQEDVRPYLAATDVYLMSSVFEGLPVALLEAMAMARPVVATFVGGIPEVIEEGKSGFLVPTGKPELLAQRVADLLSNERLRLEIGASARRTVDERFSIRRMTGQLEATYLDVLKGRGGVN